ncbi:MAG TPA: adenosylcobinamide amidohydrolase [bacterium]|jgi:adenosylcobinamide amidohydrolase|nr:adenosylcobinamide amidohydrolase [bacterium]
MKHLPTVRLEDQTLVVQFSQPAQVLSWAPLGAGLKKATHWINHQVDPSYKLRRGFPSPSKTLTQVAKKLGLPRSVVGQMTSGDIRKFKKASVTRKGWTVFALATVGFSNAVRVGEKTQHDSTQVGTINLLVWVSKPVTLPTLLEILQVAVEARTLAVIDQKVKSQATGQPATGTGTDCVAIACPGGKVQRVHAGKHTVLAELTGKAVLKVMAPHLR